jgi:hypothetical protein
MTTSLPCLPKFLLPERYLNLYFLSQEGSENYFSYFLQLEGEEIPGKFD